VTSARLLSASAASTVTAPRSADPDGSRRWAGRSAVPRGVGPTAAPPCVGWNAVLPSPRPDAVPPSAGRNAVSGTGRERRPRQRRVPCGRSGGPPSRRRCARRRTGPRTKALPGSGLPRRGPARGPGRSAIRTRPSGRAVRAG
jgi:hypothetical protein